MTPAIDLYVVVERSVLETDHAWLQVLAKLAALDTPGLALQVRAKDEPPDRFETLARQAREATADACVPVLLNGDSATARRLDFTGVHWPEALLPDSPDTDLPARGASVHTPEACTRAEAAGAQFVVAGTVFDAGSKPVAGAGLEALRAMTNATRLPVLAIGGITPERIAACVEAGATGVAVVTNVLHAPDMAAAVRALRAALDAAPVGERTR